MAHSELGQNISVVIPTYNSEKFIERAIESITAQTHRLVEVILIDDCSTDKTVEKARTLLENSGLNFKIIINQKNNGPAFSRNKGVEKSTVDYIAFLDSDDYWFPEKLSRQINLFEKYNNIALCGCQADYISPDGKKTPLFRNLPERYSDGLSELFWNNFIVTSCVLVRRQDLGKTPFDINLRAGEDRDLWFRLASNGEIGLVQEPLAEIYTSPDSYTSRNSHFLMEDFYPALRRNLAQLSGIIKPSTRRLAFGSFYAEIAAVKQSGNTRYYCFSALHGYKPLDNISRAIRAFCSR